MINRRVRPDKRAHPNPKTIIMKPILVSILPCCYIRTAQTCVLFPPAVQHLAILEIEPV